MYLSCSSTSMVRMLAPWLPRSWMVSSTAASDPQSHTRRFLSYMDPAEGPNMGWTEHTFLLDPMSLSFSMKGDFSDAMSKMSVSSPQMESSFSSIPAVLDMGTETITVSAHLQSSSVSPFPADGSMMSTLCPDCLNRSASQRPIFPYPPMMAMCLSTDAFLGRAACASIDSCMRILQIVSAYTGFIPFSRANPLYLSMTFRSTSMFLTAALVLTLFAPTCFASSSLLLASSRIWKSMFLISSLISFSSIVIP